MSRLTLVNPPQVNQSDSRPLSNRERLSDRVLFDLYDRLNGDLCEGPTHLYFITGMRWVKVGLARHVDARMATLQIGCPFKLRIAHKVKIPRAFSSQVERHTHRRLKAFAAQGEWFDVNVKTAIEAAESIVRQAWALRSIMGPPMTNLLLLAVELLWSRRSAAHTTELRTTASCAQVPVRGRGTIR